MSDFVLRLPSTQSPEALTETLRAYEPWGHRIDFDNGVSTKDLARRVPFSENTLNKVVTIERHLPTENFAGKRVLDVGCNSGYNSIYAAAEWEMKPTGIDFTQRHIDVSTMLARAAGIDATFRLDSAETYKEPSVFDLVLHLGTLYHLPNPLLALQISYDNLCPGGYLALETQIYEHPKDENICYFMNMHNNDATNFWALSPSVLDRYLAMLGFEEIETILHVKPKILEKHMARIILTARKPTQ